MIKVDAFCFSLPYPESQTETSCSNSQQSFHHGLEKKDLIESYNKNVLALEKQTTESTMLLSKRKVKTTYLNGPGFL